jgi:excinuclease ABC subunit C
MTASMVQFQEGVANKSQYRRFKIDQEKIDDFKAIKTVVTRRYQRQLKEENQLPNLIVIDGGKGQLSSAVKALESLNPYKKIPIISIAKKEEEIFFPNNLKSLKLKKNDPALHLIQEIRDESHRFAINYNKLLRSNKLKKDFYGK